MGYVLDADANSCGVSRLYLVDANSCAAEILRLPCLARALRAAHFNHEFALNLQVMIGNASLKVTGDPLPGCLKER
jgi:hypothetical protein